MDDKVPSIVTSSLNVEVPLNVELPLMTKLFVIKPLGKVISSAQSFPQIVTFSNTESPDLVNTGFDGTGQFAILG